MDHDAMNTHVTKLKVFRDDFLTLSGMSAEQFHEMAEKHRSGEPIGDLVPRRLAEADVHTDGAVSSEQLHDLSDHVKEVSETVASLQQSTEQLETVKETILASSDSLAWLAANQTALEGLLAGSAAAAHEIVDHEGSEGASKTEAPPAGSVEGADGPVSG